jgi:aldehyde dehydrogenase (NAD+)
MIGSPCIQENLTQSHASILTRIHSLRKTLTAPTLCLMPERQNSIEAICAALKTNHLSGSTRSLSFRRTALEKLRDSIKEHENDILQALYDDFHKPKLEAYASEIGFVLDDIRRTLKQLPSWMKVKSVSSPMMLFPATSAIHSEPRGVCLIIAPWNYPFQLLMSPLIGAIAAGNCVCVKPSELAPHTSAVIRKILAKIYPENFVALLEGGPEVTQALLKIKWDHIFFTGSTRVGKIVMKAAAEFLTPVTLELGGKSPCLIEPGLPMKRAAKRITWGKFFNAGQTCVAPDYLLVHADDKDRIVLSLQEAITEFYGENPEKSNSYARIVNRAHHQRLKLLLSEGKILFGGQCLDEERYIGPTLIEPHSLQTALMQDEIFGPILPLVTYTKVEEAIEFINARPHPLALYLFSQNQMLQDQVMQSCSFGGACINDTILHLSNHELPFGGVGESGLGAYHGKYSFETFSHQKAVLKNTLNFEVELRYPPYPEDRLKALKFLQRG